MSRETCPEAAVYRSHQTITSETDLRKMGPFWLYQDLDTVETACASNAGALGSGSTANFNLAILFNVKFKGGRYLGVDYADSVLMINERGTIIETGGESPQMKLTL